MNAVTRFPAVDPVALAEIDVEHHLIGSVIASAAYDDGAAWPKVRHLKPEQFREPINARIWAAIAGAEGKAPLAVLAQQFPCETRLLADMFDVGAANMAEQFAESVAAASEHRRALCLLADARDQLLSGAAAGEVLRSLASEAKAVRTTRKQPAGFTASQLMTMQFPPVAWVVHGIIPDGLSILAGRPKLGKSWMALDIADKVARNGYVFGDIRCQQGDVLYCALEDTPRRLQDRYGRIAPFGEHAERLTFWTEIPRWHEGGREALEGWMGSVQRPRLIILDTWQKIRSGKQAHESDYESDYRQMAELKSLADASGVAVVVVHHTRKMAADDPLDAVAGSTGITGAADTILVLNKSGQGATLYGRGRDVEQIEMAVEFDRETCRWRVLGEASEVRRSDERAEILSVLIDAEEPMTPAEIHRLTSLPRNNVDQLLFKMVRADEVRKAGRGKYEHPEKTDKNDKKVRNEGGSADE